MGFWNIKAHLQWHSSFNKTTPGIFQSLSNSAPLWSLYRFKYMNLWGGSFLLKPSHFLQSRVEMWYYRLSKHPTRDVLSLTRLLPLNLPRKCHQLGTKYWSIQADMFSPFLPDADIDRLYSSAVLEATFIWIVSEPAPKSMKQRIWCLQHFTHRSSQSNARLSKDGLGKQALASWIYMLWGCMDTESKIYFQLFSQIIFTHLKHSFIFDWK